MILLLSLYMTHYHSTDHDNIAYYHDHFQPQDLRNHFSSPAFHFLICKQAQLRGWGGRVCVQSPAARL